MMDQGKSITQGDWKNLIVLDACRFDYFENSYSDYLEGDLIKAKSPVSCKNGVATYAGIIEKTSETGKILSRKEE